MTSEELEQAIAHMAAGLKLTNMVLHHIQLHLLHAQQNDTYCSTCLDIQEEILALNDTLADAMAASREFGA